MSKCEIRSLESYITQTNYYDYVQQMTHTYDGIKNGKWKLLEYIFPSRVPTPYYTQSIYIRSMAAVHGVSRRGVLYRSYICIYTYPEMGGKAEKGKCGSTWLTHAFTFPVREKPIKIEQIPQLIIIIFGVTEHTRDRRRT